MKFLESGAQQLVQVFLKCIWVQKHGSHFDSKIAGICGCSSPHGIEGFACLLNEQDLLPTFGCSAHEHESDDDFVLGI